MRLPDSGSFRVGTVDLGQDLTLVIGLPTDDVDDTVLSLVWVELLVGLLAVVAAGAVGTVVVRRQLRPLREVADTAHRVAELPLSEGEIDLSDRVPEHLTDERTEVGQVGAALNTLLAHVETSLSARGTAASCRSGSSWPTPPTSCAPRSPPSPGTPSWPDANPTTPRPRGPRWRRWTRSRSG